MVRATLRPYQVDGVRWLDWVGETGPGGVLADDMGLGKTLQVLEALSRHAHRSGTVRTLIVTTTSTVHNWAREATKFAPWLRVAMWAGAGRHTHAEAIFSKYHVVITSYALLVRDRKVVTAPWYDWAILDEAQAIKSGQGSTYQAAQAIRAGRRLAMTGTPIENGAADLRALFEWSVPGIFGSRDAFAAAYTEPIGRGDEAVARRLQAVVAPYLLRRKKEDVATDLPGKTETQRFLDLPPPQRRVYDTLHEAAYSALSAGGGVTSARRLAIFAALTKLRQAACDPRLLGIPYAHGAKVRALVEILTRAKHRGEKVLVFSSFRAMVDLLEVDLRRLGFVACVITGETIDRQEQVERFQNDPKVDLFLITLKAGGSGLNLTAANVVVHFDPWWNPAAQDQASDRAYRIGQKKAVQVISLIAAGTVEERVLSTIGEKRDVASLLLGESEGKALFAHDLSALLGLIGPPRT